MTIGELAETVQKYLPETQVLHKEEAETDRRDYRISCQKIKNALGWRARYSVDDGIKELVEQAAGSTGDSVNGWVVKALSSMARTSARIPGRRVTGTVEL